MEKIIVALPGGEISNFEIDIVKEPLSYLVWKSGGANTQID